MLEKTRDGRQRCSQRPVTADPPAGESELLRADYVQSAKPRKPALTKDSSFDIA